MSTQLRTQETRHKIALGELVIQAGLGAADPTLLLGALMTLCEQIENDPKERTQAGVSFGIENSV